MRLDGQDAFGLGEQPGGPLGNVVRRRMRKKIAQRPIEAAAGPAPAATPGTLKGQVEMTRDMGTRKPEWLLDRM